MGCWLIKKGAYCFRNISVLLTSFWLFLFRKEVDLRGLSSIFFVQIVYFYWNFLSVRHRLLEMEHKHLKNFNYIISLENKIDDIQKEVQSSDFRDVSYLIWTPFYSKTEYLMTWGSLIKIILIINFHCWQLASRVP